jgi:predicted PurR-regulated permease PerM
MQRTPWLNILIVLLVMIAGLFLAQTLWQLISQFADIILLFVLAWLVAFALAPVIERISGRALPPVVVELVARSFGTRFAARVAKFHFTRLHAVTIVYLGLVVILGEVLSAFVPPVLVQLNQLATVFPSIANRAPELARVAQRFLADLGLRNVNVESALLTALGSLQNVATPVLQNAIVILGGVLTLIGNLLLVLILSFFFALDGPQLSRTVFDLTPKSFGEEVRMLANTIDRTFGGFIRAQFLQAFLVGVGTAIVMALFGGQYVLVTSLFAGLSMLIPFIGPELALIPPFLVTVILNPGQLLIILGILLIFQLIIGNVLMPKLLSDALGMHPLVVIASLLIGVKIGGLWGAFFGIPVAGVISTMALFFYRQWKRTHEQPAGSTVSAVSAAVPPPLAAPPATASPPVAAPAPARDLEKKRA